MRAIVLDEKGGPEVLRVREVPDPVIGPDEVLVDVVSTAVNRAEVLQRMGLYPQPAPAPIYEIPGLEFAGASSRSASVDQLACRRRRDGHRERWRLRVAGRGPRATGHSGAVDGVVGRRRFDSRGVDHRVRRARRARRLAPGGAVLIHAGGSGVGTAAIQIAKALDATVIVTASAGKCPRCLELGADRAVDYATDDFVEAAREATGGRGVDVVLDVIGGDYVDRNIDALASRGTILQVGTMGSGKATVTIGKLMGKRAGIVGTMLRARPLDEKITISQRFAREILPGFDAGRFAPVIDARFSLEEMPAAHRMMEANANFGKIVIDVQTTA